MKTAVIVVTIMLSMLGSVFIWSHIEEKKFAERRIVAAWEEEAKRHAERLEFDSTRGNWQHLSHNSARLHLDHAPTGANAERLARAVRNARSERDSYAKAGPIPNHARPSASVITPK